MKFGVREICDVVLKAKAAQKIGNKVFYKNEPVIYFDSLKTSSMEGAATTVYAQGGRGNSRLVAWEGERTVTFTMEDALISPEGFMILSGAGLVEASDNKKIYQHIIETTDKFSVEDDGVYVYVDKLPHLPVNKKENFAYVMAMRDGEAISEPYIPVHGTALYFTGEVTDAMNEMAELLGVTISAIEAPANIDDCENKFRIQLTSTHTDFYLGAETDKNYVVQDDDALADVFDKVDQVMVDYYSPKISGAKQIEITADKFGGNYYLEASTLFRDTNGVDMPAEFIIPNCKIQSNFTFTMASSGDPSTFTFTMDAFPDYTRFDKSKKVLAAIQIIDETTSSDLHRTMTRHDASDEAKIN